MARARTDGLCSAGNCEVPVATVGAVHCPDHAADHSAAMVARYRARVAETGRKPCKRCGGRMPDEELWTRHLCLACRQLPPPKRPYKPKHPRGHRVCACGAAIASGKTNTPLRCKSCRAEWLHRYYLKKTYGDVDYDALLRFQRGGCAICGSVPEKKRLAVDHCHQTGKVRGLLCNQCNFALGAFRDRRNVLEAAIAYLDSPPNLRKEGSSCT